jgi:hypothetical protein
MGTTYPYDFFKTDKNLSLDEIGSIYNPAIRRNVSILLKYQIEIKNYLTKNKLVVTDLERFNTLRLISDNIFNNYLILNQEILTFSKDLIISKYKLKKYIECIDTFLKLKELKIFSPYLIHSYKKNLYYQNPITSSNILHFNNRFIKDRIYINHNANKDKLEKLLDVLFHGDYINLSLPSLGAISSYVSNHATSKNFVSFTEILLLFFTDIETNNNNSNFVNNLPIVALDIDKVISNILINDLNISFNNKNKNIKNLIENNIKGINFTLNDIMFDTKTKKIKPEFLIPYKVDTVKKKIVELKKGEISSKLKNQKETIKYNCTIFHHVASEIFGDTLTGVVADIKAMDKPNYKNVLACFLFFIINLIYEYYKEYIRQINNIIIDISGSPNEQFGKLNIKEGFEFMALLNQSLYKLRLVLFNNFYNLFLPGKTQNTIYGMKKNEGGSYVPISNFLIDNNYIFNNFPFHNVEKEIPDSLRPNEFTIIIGTDRSRLSTFLTTIKSPNDIYDKEEKIEFGGFAFSQEITMDGFNMITHFFKLYKNNCDFSAFILDLVFKNFVEDKKIVIELFNDIITKFNPGTGTNMGALSRGTKENKDRLFHTITKLYSDNLSNSTKLFVKLSELVKKIKNSGMQNNSIHVEQREIIKLSAILYYYKALGIDIICKKYISDLKTKNLIITKLDEIKRENEKILSKYK